jgi:hypothetical protein
MLLDQVLLFRTSCAFKTLLRLKSIYAGIIAEAFQKKNLPIQQCSSVLDPSNVNKTKLELNKEHPDWHSITVWITR